ncbi:MAG TPA: response regulator [Planctomycetota bacterium]|nr:response regulator [Planctomycetota bacterium]HUW32895.1 response regulator [Planctomycetota bacterium]
MTKILVVEDDKNQQELYRQELMDEGYEVDVASDGKEAITKAMKDRPDLIVLDISMPGMDGIEAMGKILGTDNRIPIVLNTAYSSYKDNFMTWSADAYVIKSADLTPLKNTIKQVLENVRQQLGK